MRRAAAAMLVACAIALGACGDAENEISVDASGPDADLAEAIQAELELYEEPIDLSALPPDQQAQVGEAIDQFPQAAGTVTELTVEGGAVTAATGLEPAGEGATTAKLICGAIIRGGADRAAENVVLGSDGETLAECEPADARYP